MATMMATHMVTDPPTLLNLGCGTRIHPAWLNFDLNPVVPGVQPANFVSDIPLPDGAAACVYHSHLLEHLPLPVAKSFLRECRRVLQPGGILRVVVPDFEQSARDYLDVLARRRAGEPLSREHQWLMIEMFEQMVRVRPGGMYGAALNDGVDDPRFMAFVRGRLGSFGEHLIPKRKQVGPAPRPGRYQRLVNFLERWLPGDWGRHVGDMLFRRHGDNHQWMYDELSLGDLMTSAGFTDVRRMSYDRSSLPNWLQYGLDAEPDGRCYKSLSLYMEARPNTNSTPAVSA